MIIYPHLRTKRISVRLRELTLGESIAICKLPAERHEFCATEVLKRIACAAEAPQAAYITDPRLWTVEERAFLISTYLAQVTEDGPDFSIGDRKLSDYAAFERDIQAGIVDLGEVAGQAMAMRPLLGLHAEVLEQLCTVRGEWMIGAIACQVSQAGEPEPAWADLSAVALLDWVRARMDAIRAMPESDFEDLLFAFLGGQGGLYHFFRPVFDASGVVWACQSEEGEVGSSPARFLPISCVGSAAKRLFG